MILLRSTLQEKAVVFEEARLLQICWKTWV